MENTKNDKSKSKSEKNKPKQKSCLDNEMHVIKRNGRKELVAFDKILKRIKNIGNEHQLKHVNYAQLAIKIIEKLKDNMQTTDIDELTSEECATITTHPDYGRLGSLVIISNLQKNTLASFSESMQKLYDFKDVHNNNYKLLNDDFMQVVSENKETLDNMIDHSRDYLLDYFGFKTLERSYLMRINGKIVERPQYLWMRVAVTIHNNNMEKIKETYDLMSQKYFIHATPTLFNAGTPKQQLSSCYLLAMESDSIDGIFNTVKQCAEISKWAGGIGLHIHNVRSNGSHIRGTNGKSTGIVQMLGVFNKTARYVNQGGKRNGSFAIYLETHHPDIEDFLELRKNHGDEESKARDLFYAVWISDLFMERVMEDKDWCLFCPDRTQGLCDVYGKEYKTLYQKYEREKKFVKKIKARDLWVKILDAQMETGTPYMLYKDACNEKSNQKNLGTIKSSNLCCVTGDTTILTDKGHIPIKELENQKVNIWNGEEFSESDVFKTNNSAEIYKIGFSNGLQLKCTNYHRFQIYTDNVDNEETKIVEAQDLKLYDNIVYCEFPVIDNGKSNYYFPYRNGLYCKNVPIGYNKSIKIKWLSGFIDSKYSSMSQGYDLDNRLCKTLTLYIKTTMYKDFVLMMQTLGINTLLYGYHYDKRSVVYTPYEIDKMNKLGVKPKYYNLNVEVLELDKNRFKNQVESITVLNDKEPTYCFSEPIKHMGIFNGIYTLNCEIIEYSDDKETAVCNLASLGLAMYVKEDKTFDYDKLYQVTKTLTNNLNNVIDINFYPVEKTQRSNFLHRPVGLGVQGLADVFYKMDLEFTSQEAKEVNKLIFETIYFAALEASMEISKSRNEDMKFLKTEYLSGNWSFLDERPHCREYSVFNTTSASSSSTRELDFIIETILNKYRPVKAEIEMVDLTKNYNGAYSSFIGSPVSKGILQFDMWNAKPTPKRYNWTKLKEDIVEYGIRNSLLCAPMPTASTSQILGNNECFEPTTSNIYSRRTLAGEFIIINKYLVDDLINLGIWNNDVKNNIIQNKGSVQYIDGLPQHIKNKYKIVWEMSMKDIIDMARDRGIYICQSQSMNLWLEDPNVKSLTNMYTYAWKQGLKTGLYYLRRKAKHQSQQFTIEPTKMKKNTESNSQNQSQTQNQTQTDEGCLMCSG